jgi:hypothetical protein
VLIIMPDGGRCADFFLIFLGFFSWPTLTLIYRDSLLPNPFTYPPRGSLLYHTNGSRLKMRYPPPGIVKPLRLMPHSWDKHQTTSQEDDDREANGLSPRIKE